MKTTEELNKEIASRCSVTLLSQEEATKVLLKPIIAAGREQETRERHECLLNVCREAQKQNKQALQSKEPTETITVTIPSYWRMTARDYHEFKAMQCYYEEAGLQVKHEEVGCSGDYYAIFWLGEKPVDIINAAKSIFEE